MVVKLFKFNNNVKSSLQFILTTAKGLDLWLFGIGIFGSCALGIGMPFFLLYFGRILDSFSVSYDQLLGQVISMLYIGLYSFCTAFIGVFGLELFTLRFVKTIKKKFFCNILRQEIAYFDANEAGSFTAQLDMAIVDIRSSLSLKLSQLLMMFTMVIAMFAVSFYIHWKLALVSCAAIIFIPGSMYLTIYVIGESSNRVQKAYTEAGAIAEEAISGVRTISALNAQDYFISWYGTYISKARQAIRKFSLFSAASLSSTDAIVNIAAAIGFWYGGTLILDAFNNPSMEHILSVGNIITVNFAVISAGFALGQAGGSFNTVIKGFNSLAKLKEKITRISSIDSLDSSGILGSDHIKGDIEFHNVSFRFPNRPDVWIFKNLSFKINGGSSVAFVGPSGIGKSTIIQLLQRFYDPEEGYISIDGIPIKNYNINWIRRQFGLVSQNPRLFSLTVAENISIASEKTVTKENIVEAAKDALAHDFIMKFTNGYDTEVGEGGSQLSGGQKQRIAIARALLTNSPVLLFDEATSALDNVSEKLVQGTLDKLLQAKKHTSILVAHRLSTIKNADQIIVLNNPCNNGAQIAQVGTNNELMSDKEGLFYKLMSSQNIEVINESTDVTDSSSNNAGFNKDEISSSQESPETAFEPETVVDRKVKRKFFKNLFSKKKEKSDEEYKGTMDYPPYPSIKLFKFMAKDSIYLGLGFLASFLGAFSYPVFALIMSQYLFDTASMDIETLETSSIILPIYLGIVGIYSFLTNFFEMWSFSNSGENLVRTLRHKTFVSLLNQEIEFYDKKENSPGQLTAILAGDTQMIQSSAGLAFGSFLKSSVSMIIGLSIAFFSNAKMAGAAIGFSLLMFPGQYLENKFLLTDNLSLNEKDNKNYSKSPSAIISEVLSEIRTITSFAIEKEMLERYSLALESSHAFKDAVIVAASWAYSQGVTFLCNAGIFWFGGWLIDQGQANALDVFRVIFVLMFALMGAAQAGLFLGDQKKAATARSRVFGLINKKSLIDPSSKEGKTHTFHNIQAKDLEFYYKQRPDVRVLNSLNFNIETGKTYALVGESGCGKSSIIQLLERFYDANIRTVYLNMGDFTTHIENDQSSGIFYTHENIKDLNVSHMRGQLGLVSQEPTLFNTTIYENIRLGKLDATREEIISAAQIANADSFINSLPDKYETKVGQFGGQLSGGQKQRIVIARSLIKNPSILLLDEATSALDNESEKIVQEALDDLMTSNPRTTVVIAHRLSTIRNADKIIVLKPGLNVEGSNICEIGSHDELIALKGEYYKLYISQ